MALVKYGNGVTAYSGTISGNVYARNKSGNYTRSWRKPVNARTSFQTNVRADLDSIAAAWDTTSKTNQNAWDALAQTVSRLNRLGESYVPSGRQLFFEANRNLQTAGQSIISVAPANAATPGFVQKPTLSATLTAGAITAISLDDLPVNAAIKYMVKATPPLTAARNNVNNQMRSLGGFDGNATSVDILSAYTGRFGSAAVAGQQITMFVSATDLANGMQSTAVRTSLLLA